MTQNDNDCRWSCQSLTTRWECLVRRFLVGRTPASTSWWSNFHRSPCTSSSSSDDDDDDEDHHLHLHHIVIFSVGAADDWSPLCCHLWSCFRGHKGLGMIWICSFKLRILARYSGEAEESVWSKSGGPSNCAGGFKHWQWFGRVWESITFPYVTQRAGVYSARIH